VTYDESITYEVWIVKQNFEYHYEEGFDEAERLNADGEVFRVLYAHEGNRVGGGSECLSVEEAIAAAENAIPQGIRWDDHRLQRLFGGRRYQLSDRPERDNC
jgi:hypothetical protein